MTTEKPHSAAAANKPVRAAYFKEFRNILFIILVILIFRSSLFEPFKIPSGSMIPTLLVGDFILVNKTSYGLKIPFSDWFSDPVYITGPNIPERGDIIVFKFPKDTSINYIKRLIGLPGDRIILIEGKVYINGVPSETQDLDAGETVELKKYLSNQNHEIDPEEIQISRTKTGKVSHLIQTIASRSNYSMTNTVEFVVPADHYFVMGDNRDNSQDSRYWGYVPFGHIKGKAFMVWLNFNLPIFQTEGMEYPFMFHPDRIGKLVN